MYNIFSSSLRYLMVFLLGLILNLTISAKLSENSDETYVRIPGHLPDTPMPKSSFVEKVDADYPIHMIFVLPLRKENELEKLISEIQDPNDAEHYGKYLGTEEFIEKFAPTQEDYDKVIEYAHELGLTVTNKHSNRTLLNVIGSANLIEKSFDLKLNLYHKKERSFYAPNNDPLVPVSIANIIRGVVGLDNMAVWRPFHRKLKKSEEINLNAALAHPSGPGGGFGPNDIKIAYNLTAVPEKGLGQNIALFQLASYQQSDINQYTTFFGLPPAKLTNILVDGGSTSGINAEVTLDIELALAMAPQSQIYVYEGPNSSQGVLDTYNRIATDNIAKQISTSWGLADILVNNQFRQAENQIFLQMAAHGQTIYAASGDSGAYGNYPNQTLSTDDPASQPYMCGVGGTTLSVNPTTGIYVSETVWNNGPGNGASGGGVCTFWPIPQWQVAVPTVYSKTNRNVPDVSLDGDPRTGYSIYHGGRWVIYGGTSCAAPLWAGYTALVNQKLTAQQKPALGFVNPILYSIGLSSAYLPDFHDVTVGNNQFYSAHPGYDNCTGWGSFNGINLYNTLTNSITPPPPQVSPKLTIGMHHDAPYFSKYSLGLYQISVTNVGNGSTSGNVQSTITLPTGLSYYYSYAPGWSLTRNSNTVTFTRSSILNAGASYPTISLYVYVNGNAPSLVTPSATVAGGGSTSNSVTDPTIIR